MPLDVLNISSGNLYGGVETLLATFARERDSCPDLHRHFALCFEGRLSSELKSMGVPLTMLGEVRTRFPWTVWHARRELDRLLQRENFAVVYCHMPWNLAIFGPIVKKHKIPLIFLMHDASSGQHWIERWARQCPPDLVICNSHFTATTLPKMFPLNTPPHEVIYHPVTNRARFLPEEDRMKLRMELDTAANACVIIQVGRMEPYKGHTLHIDALARMADLPGWVCWIVGGAQRPKEIQYLAALKRRANEAGIADRIRFLGERRDVPLLLQTSDIFCQPNLSPEPFGLVFIEALNAGLPIISTKLGGAMEIVNDATGRLVEPDSPDALAAELRAWIVDPSRRKAAGRNGPARAAELCAPDKAMAQHQDVVLRLSRTKMEMVAVN